METYKYIMDLYNNYDEDSRLTSKHGQVEFRTTMRYIEKYLKKGNLVLEIGAATGRYSHTLARQGYKVDAIELVEHNIDVFRNNTLPNEDITITQGNALNLSAIPDNKYDITLLLGPLYHLYNEKDKRQAIREAIRVTKQGGIVFVAYVISDICVLDVGFYRNKFSVAEYIKNGLIDPISFATKSEPKDLFELVRKEDIDNLMSDFQTTRLHYVATDGLSEHLQETIDGMDDDTFELYLKYHFAICEREDMVGFTSHSLDIFKKD